MRNYRLNVAFALALVALASVGCSDASTPTSPTLNHPVAAIEAVAAIKPRPRGINIADLQLSSIYVSTSSGYTPFTVTVTNPTSKDIGMIYLKGELQSQNNQPPYPVSAFLGYCPNPNGVIPRGATCVMSNGITALGSMLPPGPATFTLKLQQMQPDGSMKVLDTTTAAMIVRQF